MSYLDISFPRGSEWRQWDLHIHTPASLHWTGKKYSGQSSDDDKKITDEMIHALNDAQPSVFALMDYWTFNGWFELKSRLKEATAPQLHKTVFPGIELRLAAPMKGRLNAHAIFSDKISDQDLRDFQSKLRISTSMQPLSFDALINFARNDATEAILRKHGYKKAEVDNDDSTALRAGSDIVEIDFNSYRDAILSVPGEQAIGFMPYDTSDGIKEIKWEEHYAYFIKAIRASTIFECRNQSIRDALSGEKTPENEKFYDDFQRGLQNTPRLVVSGSDAHRFKSDMSSNDIRGYGHFPSGKATWIKADPTFYGLLQAIQEPAKRSFIGSKPPKTVEVEQHKTYFIDSLTVRKRSESSNPDSWLDGVNIPLNSDLVAIIGNKGSGKSALADILALLGRSKQKNHFSFLKPGRFFGKSGEPAKSFEGELKWVDGKSSGYLNLGEDSRRDNIEVVRYIPQGHFEDLCSSHVSGSSDIFEQELRGVIFSHTDETLRLGAHDFDQLTEIRERGYHDSLDESRKALFRLNREISLIEDQLQPEFIGSVKELFALKSNQVEEHQKIKPQAPEPLPASLSPEQQGIIQEIENKKILLAEKEKELNEILTQKTANGARRRACSSLISRMRLLEKSINNFFEESKPDAIQLGIDLKSAVEVKIDIEAIEMILGEAFQDQQKIEDLREGLMVSRGNVQQQINDLSKKLDAPEMEYQEKLKALSDWESALNILIGSADVAESLEGIKFRLEQLNQLPSKLSELQAKRIEITEEIFDSLNSQRLSREELFVPVQELIARDSLIREEYKLQFKASLHASAEQIWNSVFSMIKQTTGDFRGEDESRRTIQKIIDSNDLTAKEGAINFVNSLHSKIVEISQQNSPGQVGVRSILRKDRSANELYDFIFGLSFLSARYSLLFQDTPIEQLSPGQRGALLLIFYLLVDRGRNPIILDQPEENLDNETVVGLLVPVLTKAKIKRQIIMVTHNPNLAVVCDAEQIIYSSFERKGDLKITYLSGSIENPEIRSHVINVLEGTLPAFNNRKHKYKSTS